MDTIRFLSIILILLGLGSTPLALAETFEAPEVAAFIPQSLIDQGITRVGPLELAPLVKGIKERVKWAVLPVFSIGAGTDGTLRSGSSCRMKESTVLVNDPHLQNLKSMESIRGILLHEALCALGWNDDNYIISSTLGALEKLARSPHSNYANNVRQILVNEDFLTAFRSQLKRHDDNQRFILPDQHIMLASGGVTGVGGGGDGYGWYLKNRLIQHFFVLYSICQDQPQETKIPFPGFEDKSNGLEVNVSCFEPRHYTWWSYIFSLSVETGYFQYTSEKGIFPDKMPWLGTFIIKEIGKPRSSFEASKIQITIDTFRMLTNKDQQWDEYSSLIFWVLLNKFYPSVNPSMSFLEPVIEVSGKKELTESLRNVLKVATVQKCSPPGSRLLLKDEYSYQSVSIPDYIAQRIHLTEAELKAPPYCVHVMN